tara:strand:+ start:511 stop:705 length:195 start_codon:yes stop_codon:yes gene_type:complete
VSQKGGFIRVTFLKQEGQIELLPNPIKEISHLKHLGGKIISKKKFRAFKEEFTIKMYKTSFFAN